MKIVLISTPLGQSKERCTYVCISAIVKYRNYVGISHYSAVPLCTYIETFHFVQLYSSMEQWWKEYRVQSSLTSSMDCGWSL